MICVKFFVDEFCWYESPAEVEPHGDGFRLSGGPLELKYLDCWTWFWGCFKDEL
jgi:hypothetical protein